MEVNQFKQKYRFLSNRLRANLFCNFEYYQSIYGKAHHVGNVARAIISTLDYLCDADIHHIYKFTAYRDDDNKTFYLKVVHRNEHRIGKVIDFLKLVKTFRHKLFENKKITLKEFYSYYSAL